MYVRDGKPRDETWLREGIEAMGLATATIQPAEYVIAADERSNDRAGFGRLRVHSGEPAVGELTSVGVRNPWRGQGVGAHVIERLVTKAGDAGCETVYMLTDEPGYPAQFGFEQRAIETLPEPLVDRQTEKQAAADGDVVALAIDVDDFEMPPERREAFKTARPAGDEPTIESEDFGIDAEGATYKYDTGR
ncbi:GNAT family N-acetyltransferase [Halonotius roseus]|uniref:GNAT family N-acetyltransferase n=1 Tax=Halonotius roseus TaxID=2511997 RepID=A0A544QPX0_9EURY|nr:GNAT family N-acetyltransferase [Halonotius roseus]TQQ81493.1 GNAT family N-acetyltransferase [Halonotius roseus]